MNSKLLSAVALLIVVLTRLVSANSYRDGYDYRRGGGRLARAYPKHGGGYDLYDNFGRFGRRGRDRRVYGSRGSDRGYDRFGSRGFKNSDYDRFGSGYRRSGRFTSY